MSDPQSYDNQDVSVNLDDIYNAFVNEIDRFRSRFNVPGQVDLKKPTKTIVDKAVNGATINTVPQESRCNAFYRILGLPIIAADGSFYNPGYSPDDADDTKLQAKYNIAGKISSGIYTVLDKRELFPKSQLTLFAGQDINSSAVILSFKYLRPITNIIKEDDPFAAEKQIYTVPERSKTAFNFDPLPGDPTINIPLQLPHILKPFMADPRQDFTVRPGKNRIAVPFLSDRQLMLGNNVSYTRPFLETVCRVRLNNKSTDKDLPSLQNIADAIKNNNNITDIQLMSFIGGPSSYFRSDAYIFQTLFKVFRVLVDILYISTDTIDRTMSKIHWTPIPDPNGPESGVTSRPFIENDTLPNDIDIRLDQLVKLQAIADIEIDQLKSDLGISTTGRTSPAALSALDSLAFGSVLKSIPNRLKDKFDSLSSQRDELADSAATALQRISIIMGDSSGIGLIDMYAIYAALWTVDRQVLVNMLDDAAFARLQAVPELNSISSRGASPDGLDNAQKFETRVKEILNIIDALFQAKLKNR